MPERFELTEIALPPDSEVPLLLASCQDIEPVRFGDGEFLIRGDQHGLDIYLLLRGSCLVEHPDAKETRTPGNELAILNAQPKEPVFIGEMACLGDHRRTASVRSAMSTWALRLKPEHLDVIIGSDSFPQRFPMLTRLLCRQFTQRLAQADRALKSYQKERMMTFEHRFLIEGSPVFSAGDAPERLFQLVNGSVKLSDGSVLSATDEPLFLEPEAYFLKRPHRISAIAVDEVIVLAVMRESETAVLRNYPDIFLNLFRKIAGNNE
jgi:hypothetical protein